MLPNVQLYVIPISSTKASKHTALILSMVVPYFTNSMRALVCFWSSVGFITCLAQYLELRGT